jgi:type II secretory pathway component GspD/PulD (secretin)
MRLRFFLIAALSTAVASSCRSSEHSALGEMPSELVDTTSGHEDASAVEASVAVAPAAESAPADALAAEPAAPQDLSQDAARMKLRAERAQALSAQYIAVGDQLRDRTDLAGALREYSKALEVDPTSREARDRINTIQAMMGERFATASEYFDDAVARETVRRAQAQIAAENAATQGDIAFKAGDYEKAIANYREAQTILVYHPMVQSGTLDEKIITGKLDEARARLAERQTSDDARLAAEAARDRERKAEEDRRYRENKLATLYADANAAFLADDYVKAEALANQILLQDPGNSAALEMRDTAQRARHAKQDHETQKRYREQWQRTFDELDTMDVPQTDSLVFDDLHRWRDVSQRAPLEFSAGGQADDPDTRAVLQKLESVRFPPRFKGADGSGSPLEEIAAFLQNLTGVNFLISAKVREDLDDEQKTISLELPERSVRKVLDIIADTSESLRWKVENGVVKFVTKEEMKGGQELRMYEVRDIIHPVSNFAPTEYNLVPSTGYEQPAEEVEEREGLVVTKDQLDTLIRDNIAPESWNEDPQNQVKVTDSGTLVVNQTPEVHEQIKRLLDDLREATGIMVDIQARFLKVEDNFLEDIGVDFRGLGQPGLGTNNFFNDFGDATTQGELGQEIGSSSDLGAFYDEGGDGDIRSRTENLYDMTLGDENVLTNAGGLAFQWTFLNDLQMELILRAVSKSERRELVTAPRVLVFNTAGSKIKVMNQIAYVRDFDVEIAQAASIADPIIGVTQEGTELWVRPVVSADRRFITLELRPTVFTLVRPIREVATTLGSQQSVTIQLPEIDKQQVKTTVPLPDGGTVMLGGLKVSDKQDLRSGVPLLNKIPVVRFLFQRQGTYSANQKLLILITANIVIPQELEPTQAQMGF